MTDEDTKLMETYGITVETKMVYHFDGYKYDRLSDAVKYAKVSTPRAVETQEFDKNRENY